MITEEELKLIKGLINFLDSEFLGDDRTKKYFNNDLFIDLKQSLILNNYIEEDISDYGLMNFIRNLNN